jgi:hypothetical protein
MLKALTLAAVFAAGMAMPAFAGEIELEAGESGQTEFAMPSGNVGCVVTPEGGTEVYRPADGGPEIMCDRVEPEYVRVTMGADAAEEQTDVADPSCCSVAQVLEYGDQATIEGFVCTSATTGLSCSTGDKKHGFKMARSGIETW